MKSYSCSVINGESVSHGEMLPWVVSKLESILALLLIQFISKPVLLFLPSLPSLPSPAGEFCIGLLPSS